jgi:AraC family transcriptional regulator, arabinose operon regulatory protein
MARIKSGFTGERAIVLPTPIVDEYKNTDLGSLLHITDIGFYPNASFHFRKRTKEEVSQYILIYCVEGTGWFETNNQIQNVLTNHVFILPKAEAHSYGSKSKKPWTIYWILGLKTGLNCLKKFFQLLKTDIVKVIWILVSLHCFIS